MNNRLHLDCMHALWGTFINDRLRRDSFEDAVTEVSFFLDENLSQYSGVLEREEAERYFYTEVIGMFACPIDDECPILDKYSILELRSQGGNGFVFKVKERQEAGRILALKLPRSKNSSLSDEIKILGKLKDFTPTIVPLVTEEKFRDQSVGFVMDFVDGEPLSRVIAETKSRKDTSRINTSRSSQSAERNPLATNDVTSAQPDAPAHASILLRPLIHLALWFHFLGPPAWVCARLLRLRDLILAPPADPESCSGSQFRRRLISFLIRPVQVAVCLLDGIHQRCSGYRNAVSCGIQMAEIMAKVHSVGVIHRDLKPDNVLLKNNVIRIIDFGLALAIRTTDGDDPNSSMDSSAAGDARDNPRGTPRYMSPEQHRPKDQPRQKSDVFQVGLMLHELITGDPANSGNSEREVSQNASKIPELRFIDPLIPASLNAIVRKATAREPDDRPQMAELAQELRNFYHLRPLRSLPTTLTSKLALWSARNPVFAVLVLITALLGALSAREQVGRVFEEQTRLRHERLSTVHTVAEEAKEDNPGAAAAISAAVRSQLPQITGRFTELQSEAARLNYVLHESRSDLSVPLLQHLHNSSWIALHSASDQKLQLYTCQKSPGSLFELQQKFSQSLLGFNLFCWNSDDKSFLIAEPVPIPDAAASSGKRYKLSIYTTASPNDQIDSTKPNSIDGSVNADALLLYNRQGKTFFAVSDGKLLEIIKNEQGNFRLNHLLPSGPLFKKTSAAAAIHDGSILIAAADGLWQIKKDIFTGDWSATLNWTTIQLEAYFEDLGKQPINRISELSDSAHQLLISNGSFTLPVPLTPPGKVDLNPQGNFILERLPGSFFTHHSNLNNRFATFATIDSGDLKLFRLDKHGRPVQLFATRASQCSFSDTGDSLWYGLTHPWSDPLHHLDLRRIDSEPIPVPTSINLPKDSLTIGLAHVPCHLQGDTHGFCAAFTFSRAESGLLRLFSHRSVASWHAGPVTENQHSPSWKSESTSTPQLFSIGSKHFVNSAQAPPNTYHTRIFEITSTAENKTSLIPRQTLPGFMIAPSFDQQALLLHESKGRITHYKSAGTKWRTTNVFEKQDCSEAVYLRNCNAVLFRTTDHLTLKQSVRGLDFPISDWRSGLPVRTFAVCPVADKEHLLLINYKNDSCALFRITSDLDVQELQIPPAAASGDAVACAITERHDGVVEAAVLSRNGKLHVFQPLEAIAQNVNGPPQTYVKTHIEGFSLDAGDVNIVTRIFFSPAGHWLLIAPEKDNMPVWIVDRRKNNPIRIPIPTVGPPRRIAQWLENDDLLYISTEQALFRIPCSDPNFPFERIPDAHPANLLTARVQNQDCLLSLERIDDTDHAICLRNKDGILITEKTPVDAFSDTAVRLSLDAKFVAITTQHKSLAGTSYSKPHRQLFTIPVNNWPILYHAASNGSTIVFDKSSCTVIDENGAPSTPIELTLHGKLLTINLARPLNDFHFLLKAGDGQLILAEISPLNPSQPPLLTLVPTEINGQLQTTHHSYVVSLADEKQLHFYRLNEKPGKVTLDPLTSVSLPPSAQVNHSTLDLQFTPVAQEKLLLAFKHENNIHYTTLAADNSPKAPTWKLVSVSQLHDFLLFNDKLQFTTAQALYETLLTSETFSEDFQTLRETIQPSWILRPPDNCSAAVATADMLTLLPLNPQDPSVVNLPYNLNLHPSGDKHHFFQAHRTWHAHTNGTTFIFLPGKQLECWPLDCFYSGHNAPPRLRLAPRPELLPNEKRQFNLP